MNPPGELLPGSGSSDQGSFNGGLYGYQFHGIHPCKVGLDETDDALLHD